MAAPQGGYPPQEGYYGYGYAQPGYGSPGSPSQQQQPAGVAQGTYSHGQPGGRRKRAYAGEAFEFGSGANAALGGQETAGGAYGPPPPGYGGATMGYPQPVYGDPGQVYPQVPGYGPSAAPEVGQMTQQFGAMGVADPYQYPQQPAQGSRVPVQLNQLYPTDLLAQPFNVAELDYPPPPIILPPNVSLVVVVMCELLARACFERGGCLFYSFARQVFSPPRMRTVPRSTYDRPLMPSPLRTRS